MRLPELRARPQRAERPSLDTVRPTDLGLGAVARDAAEWQAEVDETRRIEAEVQRAEDEQAVQPLLDELKTGYEARFAEDGAAWDGVSPGFARQATGVFDEMAGAYARREGLTPGQQDALNRGVSQYREASTQRAVQYQAQRRGQLAAEAAQAREATAVGGVMAGFAQAFAEDRREIDDAYDGSASDYADRVMGRFDARSAEAIEAAPEPIRARVTQQMASQRLAILAQAMDAEARGEQAYVAAGAKQAGDQLVNAVLTAPSLYETSLSQVDQVVAGLPAAQRGTARRGLIDSLTEGYVEGLIRDGQQETALTALNGGALDGRLAPETKARLLERATRKSEELDVGDWMARLQLQGAIEDDIASRAATGVGVGVDPGQVASVLGPREAAEYMLAVQSAERTRATVEGFGQMTPGQIRAQVEALKPEPGAADFADAQRRYELAGRAAEAEIKARESDPAAWGLSQASGLRDTLGRIGVGDEQSSRRAAAAYAVSTLTLQETAGVDASQRRILPKATAAGMVAAMEQNPDPGEGLRGLGAVIRAFDPPAGADGRTVTAALNRQRMIVNELRAAGADNGDIAAALDLGDDPVRLGRYVAADRNKALDGMKPKDREEIEDAVDAQLAPYLRSFGGLPVSAALTGGRRLMAQRLAAERVARRGGSVRDAAREAAETVAGQYVFVGSQGWRMPRGVAERREGQTFGQTLASRGASRIVSTLSANDGAGFYAPGERGDGLNEAQRRERYADTVRTRGRWFTTPDDAGLVLMTPTLDGRWTPALDRGGGAITRSWAALQDAGRDRRPSGQRVGGAPRGIRNNNPGNIEHRSNNRWQGQTGHDGRFARFATPEQGLRALSRDLGTKMGRGLNTVRSILTTYAPPGENDTAAYIRAVSGRLGISPDAAIGADDVRLRAGLMAAIIQHENGQQPYSPSLIAEAARQGMRR